MSGASPERHWPESLQGHPAANGRPGIGALKDREAAGAQEDGDPRRGFVVTEGRAEKAAKIRLIIREAAGRDLSGQRLLDIGVGTGEIISILARDFDAFGVDILDQRRAKAGHGFALCNEVLPFPDRCFDLVVSNHVIEHVANPWLHLTEIARVLRPGGYLYLATPNRWWPWEVHYQLPLLHYLPKPLFERLLTALGRFREGLRLFGWRELASALRPSFEIRIFSDKIIRDPRRYFLPCPPWAARILGWVPSPLLRRLVFLHPTFVLVLIRRQPP